MTLAQPPSRMDMSPDQATAPDCERTKQVVYAVVYGIGGSV